MRVGVLTSPESWYFRDLVRAGGADCEFTCLDFSRLRSEIGTAGDVVVRLDDQDLASFDAMLVRTMPPGSLEQVVFRMDLLGRLEAEGTLVLNPPRAVEAAVDKYLTTARLAAAGLRSPRTIVCHTCDDALIAFAQLGSDVVVKPLFGSEGRGLIRITDESLAWRAFRMLEQAGAIIYAQEFIEHSGYDIRVLLIGEEAYAMQRMNRDDWRTNISRGAQALPYDLSDEVRHMARRAAAAVGAPLAGVDLLPGRDGSWYVLEVNAVPGWKALAAACEIDIAARVLSYVRERIRERQGGRR